MAISAGSTPKSSFGHAGSFPRHKNMDLIMILKPEAVRLVAVSSKKRLFHELGLPRKRPTASALRCRSMRFRSARASGRPGWATAWRCPMHGSGRAPRSWARSSCFEKPSISTRWTGSRSTSSSRCFAPDRCRGRAPQGAGAGLAHAARPSLCAKLRANTTSATLYAILTEAQVAAGRLTPRSAPVVEAEGHVVALIDLARQLLDLAS